LVGIGNLVPPCRQSFERSVDAVARLFGKSRNGHGIEIPRLCFQEFAGHMLALLSVDAPVAGSAQRPESTLMQIKLTIQPIGFGARLLSIRAIVAGRALRP